MLSLVFYTVLSLPFSTYISTLFALKSRIESKNGGKAVLAKPRQAKVAARRLLASPVLQEMEVDIQANTDYEVSNFLSSHVCLSPVCLFPVSVLSLLPLSLSLQVYLSRRLLASTVFQEMEVDIQTNTDCAVSPRLFSLLRLSS